MGLYENVKSLCSKKKTSVMALEDKLGFPRSSICKWDTNIPSIAKVQKVADELEITLDELTKEVDFQKKKETT